MIIMMTYSDDDDDNNNNKNNNNNFHSNQKGLDLCKENNIKTIMWFPKKANLPVYFISWSRISDKNGITTIVVLCKSTQCKMCLFFISVAQLGNNITRLLEYNMYIHWCYTSQYMYLVCSSVLGTFPWKHIGLFPKFYYHAQSLFLLNPMGRHLWETWPEFKRYERLTIISGRKSGKSLRSHRYAMSNMFMIIQICTKTNGYDYNLTWIYVHEG